MTILDKILAEKADYVRALRADNDIAALQRSAEAVTRHHSLRRALADAPGGGIIAEFKRRSPSKGDIHADARVADVIPAYEAAGASAFSVLADTPFFGGGMEDIRQARMLTDRPILCKEFIIDEAQIWQARVCGADAILLIAAAIGAERCHALARVAHDSGLEVLLEIHEASELGAFSEAVDVIGVNNRDLKNFVTNPERSLQLFDNLPASALPISESGLLNPDDARRILQAGYRGLLIGEAFMRTPHPGEALRVYVEALRRKE
jgi:indole-3-glycerol phosphate synthase